MVGDGPHGNGRDIPVLAELNLPSEQATRALGASVARSVLGSMTIGLVGPLGAGKTTFMQGFMEVTGRSDEVRSPTYTLVNSYEGTPRVHHIDLYRLQDEGDLESIGIWEYLDAPGAICCIEWIDRFWACWTERDLVVELRIEGKRRSACISKGQTCDWDFSAFQGFWRQYPDPLP
jgi:tRNA threonylcarbamoyladenosine biosynthesis protein TsaE